MTTTRTNRRTATLATDLATGRTFGLTLNGNGMGAFAALLDRAAAGLFGATNGASARNLGNDTFELRNTGERFSLEFFGGRG